MAHYARATRRAIKSARPNTIYRAATVAGYANIASRTRLVDTRIDDTHTGSADICTSHANIASRARLVDTGIDDTPTGSAHAGACNRACDTPLGNANRLAINDGIRCRHKKQA